MVAVIVGTLAVATFAQPDRVADLRTEGVAALTYHLNWRLILDQQSYFEAADGPSALEHLWSLSIEEQFYLVFPLLAAFVLAAAHPAPGRADRRSAWRLVSTCCAFAWYEPASDPSPIYFSPITRAAGLLPGVALACSGCRPGCGPTPAGGFTSVLDSALAGIGVVAWYMMSLTEHRPSAFRLSFTAGAARHAAGHRRPGRLPGAVADVAALLGEAPAVGRPAVLRHLPVHWPVIVFTSGRRASSPSPRSTSSCRSPLILGLAALSYR